MLSRLQTLIVKAFVRLGPHPRWFLGSPLRATVAAVQPAGYVLMIRYTEGTDWVTLPSGRRQGEEWTALATEAGDERLSEDELAAVDIALTERRLARTEPWGIDTDGRLAAAVAVIKAADR